MMLMTRPVCRQTHDGYVGCLDVIATTQHLVKDLADPAVQMATILDHIETGEYNVGNSLAFATGSADHSVAAMHPALAFALKNSNITLTNGDLVDMDKCDYVWEGVGCLTIVQVRESDGCAPDATAEKDGICAHSIVPIMHLFEEVSVGSRRREARKIVGGVVGGVPDLRKVAEVQGRRRAGQGGECGSGLGEMLMCHCNSRGCGYLDYYNDILVDGGRAADHPDVVYGGAPEGSYGPW